MDAVPEVEVVPEAEVGSETRRTRHLARVRRQRTLVAALLAVVGASSIIAAVTFGSDGTPAPARTAGSTNEPTAGQVVPGETGGTTAKPPSDAPGGVGASPEKTGLPARPAEGGEVRTGTAEEGCFENVREYLEEWDRTGVEPDPCFTAQPASNQKQPDGVQRTYNGERF